MAKAQNPDVIEIGSSSVEELSRDDESPSKIMMMSTKGTFYFKILDSKYHKTKIKLIKGQQRQFKPFIVEKKTRVADKKIQTEAWLTVVHHQECQCQLIGKPLGKESTQEQFNERQ